MANDRRSGCSRLGSPFALLAMTLAATTIGPGGEPAMAAELSVLSAGAVRGVLRGMVDNHGARTGHKIKLTFGSTGLLRDTIASGARADLIIASAPLMSELEQSGKLL